MERQSLCSQWSYRPSLTCSSLRARRKGTSWIAQGNFLTLETTRRVFCFLSPETDEIVCEMKRPLNTNAFLNRTHKIQNYHSGNWWLSVSRKWAKIQHTHRLWSALAGLLMLRCLESQKQSTKNFQCFPLQQLADTDHQYLCSWYVRPSFGTKHWISGFGLIGGVASTLSAIVELATTEWELPCYVELFMGTLSFTGRHIFLIIICRGTLFHSSFNWWKIHISCALVIHLGDGGAVSCCGKYMNITTLDGVDPNGFCAAVSWSSI